MATKKKAATKKTTKPKAVKATKKTEAPKVEKPKKLPVGKGPLGYTTSNVFKAPLAKVWAAAVENKHLKGHFVDDMKGSFAKDKIVSWFWKEWGWWPAEVVKYVHQKELIYRYPDMSNKYLVTVRYEILKKDGKTIFRIHESGYAKENLNNVFMMCEGWSEFHTGMKAYLLGVDLRKG